MSQASENKSPRFDIGHHLHRGLREGALYVTAALSLYLFISLGTYHPMDPGWSHSGGSNAIANLGGRTGAWFSDVFLYLFGYMAYLFPLMVAYSGWLLFRGRGEGEGSNGAQLTLRGIGFVLTMTTGAALAYLHFRAPEGSLPLNAGGILGQSSGGALVDSVSFLGATLFLLALFLTGVTLFTGLSWLKLMDKTGEWTLRLMAWLRGRLDGLRDRLAARKARQEREQLVTDALEKSKKRKPPQIAKPVEKKPQPTQREQKEKQTELFAPSTDEGGLPSLSLLDPALPPSQRTSPEALEAIARLVEMKLADFGIEVEVVEVHPGPVITRFELQPAPGVKVSQIVNLSKDLARSLSTVSVRVVEVIPGKTTVGLEIPNEHREIVYFSETIKSEAYEKAGSPLTMALGKDIAGEPSVADLAKMPHLLVAGTTGSGKSVAVNAMILSLLYNATPKDVRLIMVDPKMLELSIYDGIPHLLAPVVTDMKDAANALRWCVAEMERRYKLMAAMGVRNIGGFNKKVKEAEAAKAPLHDPTWQPDPLDPTPGEAPELEKLPYIVVVVDELADMMMVVGKKVEELIARLAQKARAAGIHLILATQRPSVDVLTGLIKANIPTRIAFQVSSRIDSRTILDQMGAEHLLGKGDMLYLSPGQGVPMRVHGAMVSDDEVHRVVEDLKSRGAPEYEEAIINGIEESGSPLFPGDSGAVGGDSDESDPLYDEAVQIVTETRRASVSGVQRRLKIGYNRAARLVETMEQAGVVSPLQANGSREVLAPPPPKD